MTSKLILLSQPVHRAIDETEMIAAVPEAEALLPRRTVSVGSAGDLEEAIRTGDWSRARTSVEVAYRDELKPLLDADGDASLRYFGAAPIPLAMLLGSLVGSWARVTAHVAHHDRKDWLWTAPDSARPRLVRPVLPKSFSRAAGDIIVRVVTSIPIDVQTTLEVVPTPVAEYDIGLEPAGLDAVDRIEVLEEVADCFRAVLDDIAANFPNTSTVHVFASIPVGLAFRMGTGLSPTMHPPVQTYYYDQKSEPKQRPAVRIFANEGAVTRPLSDEEHRTADVVRAAWAEQADQLRGFTALQKERAANPWTASVLPRTETRSALVGGWVDLPHAHDTVLLASKVDLGLQEIESAFDFRWTDKQWVFDDHLLVTIARRLVAADLSARAGRMLMFHEAVHLRKHSLTRQTSEQVGRFPKLLEELDYQADVWAMLHEYAFSLERGLTTPDDAVRFFVGLLDVALETFWAFDDGPEPLRQIQVRRMNRYLLWYWQHLRIERCSTLEQVIEVLASKPTLELAGPRLEARGERVFYDLDARHVDRLELAVLHNNSLHRYASGPATNLNAMLDGFRSRNGELVKESLAGIFAQVVR